MRENVTVPSIILWSIPLFLVVNNYNAAVRFSYGAPELKAQGNLLYLARKLW